MNQRSNYAEAWNEYRKRRLIFAAVLLSYVPGVWLAAVPISLLTGIKSDYFAYPAMGAWMLAFLVTWLRLATFRCPRCGNHFFTSWWRGNPIARKCLHCRLPKWATSG
jgi:hypothetical protein